MKKLSILLLIALLALPLGATAATVIIQNADGAGEGFNDPGAPTVAPGNSGTTLGEQRLFAFQYAADIWGAMLSSPVTILVQAQMNSQTCTPTSAVLGSAGTNFIQRDFAGAPLTGTWYPDALADAIYGSDLNPGFADIVATFNSNINGDPSCLGGLSWYYGTDLNPPGNDIDFITVVAHELGHGLGFQSFMSQNGNWFSGFPDAYASNMRHVFAPEPSYLLMSAGERGLCNIGDPNTRWDGAAVKANANNILTSGALGGGRTQLHCPNPYVPGSSVSHWSTALSPNQLLEPFYVAPNHDITFEAILFKDLGWTLLQQVATAVSSFEARPGPLGVDIAAEFASDADAFTVNLYRGAGETRPDVLIHGRDLRVGDAFAYTDRDVVPGEVYTYQIAVRDHDGEFLSPMATVTVPAARTTLAQNVPNPFNPTTKISFTLANSEDIVLTIHDIEGRLVRTLASGVRGYGPHEVTWDGRNEAGVKVGTGVYFYRLVAGKFTDSKKMVLLK